MFVNYFLYFQNYNAWYGSLYLSEIMYNCKLAREMSQTSMVYYQGVITQISKLLSVMEQPGWQAKWRTIRAELTQEWELAPSQGGGAQAEEGEGQCRGG